MNVSTAIALPRLPSAPPRWLDLPAAEGFARMVGSGLQEIEPLLDPAAGMEIEAVHDLRIGVRRLRAALALFAPVLGPAAGRFDDRLRTTGRLLGAVRDWQVLRTETLAQARTHGLAEPCAAVLAEAAAEAARRPEDALRAALREQVPALLPALAAWAGDGMRAPALLGDPEPLGRPLPALVPVLMTRLRHRVIRRTKGYRHADAAALHRLRKRAKTLRYATELLAPLYGEKRVRKLAKRCKHLQDLLGRINDAAATPELLSKLAPPPESELAEAVRDLRAHAEARGAAARRKLPAAWHALRDTTPFWT